jgi:hypothetical protein
MKKMTSYLAVLITVSACSGETGPGPDIHDSKYIAVDGNGEVVSELPAQWPCVLDQFTGLTWEVKTDMPGLHDWRNTYSWYDPDEAHDGELDYRGTPDAGQCQGSGCDTHAFVEAVNQAGLCGHHDWRAPLRDELATISDPRQTDNPPTTNMRYFPNMQSAEYWSSNDYSFQWNSAWVWSFQTGLDRVEWKATPRHVRLVRGEAQYLQRVKD